MTAPADAPAGAPETLTVLVYSDDIDVRRAVETALGRRVARDLPGLEFVPVATEPAVWRALKDHDVALMILDGEATPAGGMGVCRQAKDEVFRCPPVLVLVGRPQDAWLATWSRADAVVAHPIDPLTLAGAVADLLRATRPADAATAR